MYWLLEVDAHGVWWCEMMGSYVCGGCVGPLAGAGVDVGVSADLESVDEFCCLGDMLNVDGGC